jgi:FixJ family two-component response regulator
MRGGTSVDPDVHTDIGSDPSASRVRLAVFIVDSDAKVREHLIGTVRAAGWQGIGFGSAEELLADPRSRTPGCILLDVDLPGLSGLELQQRLAERAGISVIFASASRDVRLMVRAIKAGAVNFLAKPVDRETLVSALTEALECSRASLSRDAEQRVLRGRFATLSARELEVLELVLSGRLNKQVAAELGIAEVTVKVHRGRGMRKLGATSFAELVRLGARLGVGVPDGRPNAPGGGEEGRSAPQATARARGMRRFAVTGTQSRDDRARCHVGGMEDLVGIS